MLFAAVAAGGAIWAARIAKRALFDLERAFVTVKDLTSEVTNGPDGKKVAAFQAIFLNSGGSPTKHALHRTNCAVMQNPLPRDFAFGDVERESVRFVMGPGATTLTSSIELPLETLRGKHTYMWGWIEYDDIFARTPRHRTEFCYKLVMVENPGTGQGRLHFETHRDHNGTDDECPPERWRTEKGGVVIRDLWMPKVVPKTA